MFCGPRISIHPCNENQLVALFYPQFILSVTLYMFQHICSPSSGGILYIYKKLVCIVLFSWLLSKFHPNLANRQSTKRHNTYQLLYIYSIPPDDGLQICPKHVGVDRRNTLRTNSASSWFSLQESSKCKQDQRYIWFLSVPWLYMLRQKGLAF